MGNGWALMKVCVEGVVDLPVIFNGFGEQHTISRQKEEGCISIRSLQLLNRDKGGRMLVSSIEDPRCVFPDICVSFIRQGVQT